MIHKTSAETLRRGEWQKVSPECKPRIHKRMQLKLLVCRRSSANAGNMIIAEPVRTLKFDAYFDRVD